ncbi:uncharacterized protein LOC127880876 [Dreissena polymorpha]|uniref:uncharacterized protein LOC127880876 n=1 Tax=Dreissena polymorpha TaxID=45954 RepID=UPI0022640E4B|nr:uncharacterized protein LOC127880876 [Dreissena polymorpha]
MTSVGVNQGRLLSPILLNIFIETCISIGRRIISNLRFADYNNLMGGTGINLKISPTDYFKEQEHTGCRSARLSRNSTTNTSADINMNGEKLEVLTTFIYVGATLSNDGTSTAEVQIRIALETESMTILSRLSRLLTSILISFATKHMLFKSLEVSSLLYGCETLTLHADTEQHTDILK